MSPRTITIRDTTHIARFIRDLMKVGWTVHQMPAVARLVSNRQPLELRTPSQSLRIRPSIYKVGNRGEPHRLDERRIEITTTYASSLAKDPSVADVVLGFDEETNAYVGLDPRRLDLGGPTHNASSSVDPAALRRASSSKILVQPHNTRSLGLEYQAIFQPPRLAEYLFNYASIHKGDYDNAGLFSGASRKRRISERVTLSGEQFSGRSVVLANGTVPQAVPAAVTRTEVEAYERDDTFAVAALTPAQLDAILRKCREVGDKGEYFVYQHERNRLQRAGRTDLANKVRWVSRERVNAGYDIKSFNADGTPKYIEVKSTMGVNKAFKVSRGEWTTATTRRSSYWIFRVVNTLSAPRIDHEICDPVDAHARGVITKEADGWIVTVA